MDKIENPYREIIKEIEEMAMWHCDEEADPDNTSPEDMVAHVNGLIVLKCRWALEYLKK